MSAVGECLSVRTCRIFSVFAGVSTAAVGILSLVGWWLSLPVLTSVVPGLATMKPNSAVCFVMLGASVCLIRNRSIGAAKLATTQSMVARMLTVAAALVGLLTLSEYVFNDTLSLDNVFFRETLNAIGGPYPGRMSATTAASFSLIGVAVFLTTIRTSFLAQSFAILATLSGLVASIGYLIGVRQLYEVSAYSSMAVHTSLLLVLLGIGTLAARPQQGVMAPINSKYVGGVMARRVLPFVIGMPIVLSWLRWRGQEMGLYGTQFGIAILTLSEVVIFSAVIWMSALWLNRVDEQRLQAERQTFQLAAIVESSEDAILSKDLSGTIVSWNHGAERLYGYSPEEIIGKPIETIIPSQLRDEARLFLSEISKGRLVTREETLRRRKDGTLIHVSLVISPIRDHDGRIVGASTIAHDITERMQTEEIIRQSEERFSKAFRSSPMAITIATLDEGRYVDANDAFLSMMGCKLDEIIGRTSTELNVWADPHARAQMVAQLGESGRVRTFETRLNTRVSGIRLVQLVAETVWLNDRPCILAIINDITEARSVEEQFRQSQKMEAVGRLAGGVAHDFNNLLGVILGYCELSREQVEPDNRVVKHLDQIKKAAQRAGALTRQLLAFSRQQVLQPRVLNLNAVVNNLSNMLLRMIGEDVSLKFIPGAPLDNIRADTNQVEQVLMNLAVNARDAMPSGGKIIIETSNSQLDEGYARQHAGVKPGDYVMLSMSDTGCGMNSETISKIFEPFFTTKPLGEGTGLGLSTVYGIVKQSGGHIWVYSEPGKGTTFKLYFPRVVENVDVLHQSIPEPLITGGSETILVVEDDDELRELTVTMLQKEGYRVLEAKDGKAAVNMAREYQGPIDLLLTDVVMPGMSGGEVAKGLKGLRPEVAIVYMSGYTGNLISHHSMLDADTPLLQKPFTKRALMRQLRSVLDRQET